MTSTNVVLDFTQNKSQNNQPLAVMSASMAKKLLQLYAKQLERASASEIIGEFVTDLQSTRNNDELTPVTKINTAVDQAQDFVNERNLITAVLAGNWDLYKVEQEVESATT